MTLKKFQFWNKIIGWTVFAIALITYTLTLEPTVSYWDCGEYLATSVKLEVGHPPGAPLFQMMGAFFAMFTTEVDQIAYAVNFMSGLASAFTILFMFWSMTMLLKKISQWTLESSQAQSIAILGASAVGSLAYTFSDSFWFSAVEAEVYAMSSFLMAALFWLGLKWEENMDKIDGNKWLLLISLTVGLSFGVHILSLLVIPAIVFLYLYKHYDLSSPRNFIIANGVAIAILALIFKVLFPFTLKFFSVSELFFVNTIGLPFNSGSIIAMLVIVALFWYGLKKTREKNLPKANTAILATLFIVIGFSSWMMLPIRSNADTTINENNPSSARELLAYYNREQYGDANVFYDTYYSVAYDRKQDVKNPYRDDKPKYEKDEKLGKYVIVNDYEQSIPNYSDTHKGFIPRMVNPSNSDNYKSIAGIPANSSRRPTMGENLYFMIDYQFGYMYLRYLMWNFVGKQNDIQGNLDIFNGNWLSGITFIDEMFLGPQDQLPSEFKENKGRNTYYFLPLIFGLIGIFWHVKKDPKSFWVLFLFFAFTGLAIIFYTNPRPFEPRERDYAVVGSFYIFAIWIGFGAYAIFEKLKQKFAAKSVAIGVTTLSLLLVPTLMASENWDDHDRSNRYSAHLNAQAYLDSCLPNSIMFTIGDNDTFPLWYMQEVEDYRTDLKLINTSLLNTDWYIDQQKRKTYDAEAIPSQLKHEQYKYGTLDAAYYVEFAQLKDSVMSIKDFMRWISSDSDITYAQADEKGTQVKIYPSSKIRIPVNKENVLASGIVKPEDADLILPYIDIEIQGSAIGKNRILMLDIIANNDWKRPIYFTGGASAAEEYIWMKDYLQLDGLSYRLVPIKTPVPQNLFDLGRIDSKHMKEIVMDWEWDKYDHNNMYIDSETRKNSISFRNNLMRLSEQFLREGDSIQAIETLDFSLEQMPIKKFGHYGISLGYPQYYYLLNSREKARETAETLIEIFQERLNYYSLFDESYLPVIFSDIENNLNMYRSVMSDIVRFDTEEYANQKQAEFIEHIELFESLLAE